MDPGLRTLGGPGAHALGACTTTTACRAPGTSFDRLLSYPRGGCPARTPSSALSRGCRRAVGPRGRGASPGCRRHDAPGPAPTAGRVRLERARMLRDGRRHRRGARRGRERVAAGFGAAAAEARLLLARWRLAQAGGPGGRRATPSRSCSPAEDDPERRRPPDGLAPADRLWPTGGLDEPLALVRRREIARDEPGSPARGPGSLPGLCRRRARRPVDCRRRCWRRWPSPRDEGDRAWLRGRLEGRAESPYVLAARGEPAPGLEALEEELARRLQEIEERVETRDPSSSEPPSRTPCSSRRAPAGSASSLSDVLDLDALGGFVTKSVTARAAGGQPRAPGDRVRRRHAELRRPGQSRAGGHAADKLPWIRDNVRRARVFVSVAGHRVDDYPAPGRGAGRRGGLPRVRDQPLLPQRPEAGTARPSPWTPTRWRAIVAGCRAGRSGRSWPSSRPTTRDLGRPRDVADGGGCRRPHARQHASRASSWTADGPARSWGRGRGA